MPTKKVYRNGKTVTKIRVQVKRLQLTPLYKKRGKKSALIGVSGVHQCV
jgi:hypothetical protein